MTLGPFFITRQGKNIWFAHFSPRTVRVLMVNLPVYAEAVVDRPAEVASCR